MREIDEQPEIDAALKELSAEGRESAALDLPPRIAGAQAGIGNVGAAEMVQRQIGRPLVADCLQPLHPKRFIAPSVAAEKMGAFDREDG